MPDSLGEAVRARRRLSGTVLTMPGASVAELLAEPFDVVWVDLEHGALGRLDAQEMLVGAQAAGAYAMVRLPAEAHGLMTAMADAGADGVVLADVRDPETAASAVARLVLPPGGVRGYGPRRLSLRGRTGDRSAAGPSLWVQIESTEGVERAWEIAVVEGVDALVVGTADLSFAVGRPLDSHAPELLEAIAHVRAACEAAGIAFGAAGSLDAAPPAAYAGATILMHGTDARLSARAMDDAAAWMRSVLDDDEERT